MNESVASRNAGCTGVQILGSASMKEAVAVWMEDPEMSLGYGSDIGCCDVSEVSDMTSAFTQQRDFNEPLSCWNASKDTSMESMFFKA